jgi:hypothetical protein
MFNVGDLINISGNCYLIVIRKNDTEYEFYNKTGIVIFTIKYFEDFAKRRAQKITTIKYYSHISQPLLRATDEV